MTQAPASSDISIPPRLASRPRHGGLPIPYVAPITEGVPDFRLSDARAVARCLTERLCALCGVPLDYWIVFVAEGAVMDGPRCFTDPPLHEGCARYSLAVCPFLLGTHPVARPTPPPQEGERDLFTPTSPVRPAALFLGWTRAYTLHTDRRNGGLFVRAAPFVRRELIPVLAPTEPAASPLSPAPEGCPHDPARSV